jgi:hypothetical protein
MENEQAVYKTVDATFPKRWRSRLQKRMIQKNMYKGWLTWKTDIWPIGLRNYGNKLCVAENILLTGTGMNLPRNLRHRVLERTICMKSSASRWVAKRNSCVSPEPMASKTRRVLPTRPSELISADFFEYLTSVHHLLLAAVTVRMWECSSQKSAWQLLSKHQNNGFKSVVRKPLEGLRDDPEVSRETKSPILHPQLLYE